MTTRLEYDLTPDDVAAFGEFCVRNTPEFARAVGWNRAGGIVVILGISVALYVHFSSVGLLVTGFVSAAAFGWYWPRQVIRNARERMLRQTRACLNSRHVLETTDEGIHAACGVSDTRIRWQGFETIVEADEHVFLILDPGRGFMIPKKRIVAGDLGEFVRVVQERLRPAPVINTTGT